MAAMSVNEQKGHSTIKAPATIDAGADAGVLRKAMKGIGELVDDRKPLPGHILRTCSDASSLKQPFADIILHHVVCDFNILCCPFSKLTLLH